jgi:hypothetical protein
MSPRLVVFFLLVTWGAESYWLVPQAGRVCPTQYDTAILLLL